MSIPPLNTAFFSCGMVFYTRQKLWHTHPEISQNRTDLTHCRVLYLEDDSGNYILYLLHEQVFVRKLIILKKLKNEIDSAMVLLNGKKKIGKRETTFYYPY